MLAVRQRCRRGCPGLRGVWRITGRRDAPGPVRPHGLVPAIPPADRAGGIPALPGRLLFGPAERPAAKTVNRLALLHKAPGRAGKLNAVLIRRCHTCGLCPCGSSRRTATELASGWRSKISSTSPGCLPRRGPGRWPTALCRRPATLPVWPGCAPRRPAAKPTSSARPTCTSWPTGSAGSTPRSARRSTRSTRPGSRAARRAGRRWRWPAAKPTWPTARTPAARSGSRPPAAGWPGSRPPGAGYR